MKINRSSWHYRFRAWVLRESGYGGQIEPIYGSVGMIEYIVDIVVFGIISTPSGG